MFESLLSECRDAIQAVREDLKPDQVSTKHQCFHKLVFFGDFLLLSNLLNGKSDFLDFFNEMLQTSLPPLI